MKWALEYSTVGCLPEYLEYYDSLEDCIESARDLFDITEDQAWELFETGTANDHSITYITVYQV